jgi:hypothetical protein
MSYKHNLQPMTGESFVRCNQIVVDNRLNKTLAITFSQETIVGGPDGAVLHIPMSPVPMAFDPAATIPIINPETGEDTGQTATQAEVYALIYSAYLATVTAPPDGGAV